jgi:hypothetical protein
MGNSKDEDDLGQKLAEVTCHNLQGAVMELHSRIGKPSKSSALALMMNGCVAAVQSLALLVGGCEGCDESGHHGGHPSKEEMMEVGNKHVNPTSLLFAAILINKVSPDGPDRNGATDLEISPVVIHDALDTVEQLTGKRPDEFLDPCLCRQVREFVADSGVPLAKLLESRKASPSKTLN